MRLDLDDPAARAAYRRELAGLARGWRWAAFLVVALGAGGLIYARLQGIEGPLRTASWIALALGWTMFATILLYRSRHHKARMAGD